MKTRLLTLLLCIPLFCAAQPTTVKPTVRVTDMALSDAETIMVLGDNAGDGYTDIKTNVSLQKYNLISGAKVWEKQLVQSRTVPGDQQRISRTKDGGYIINMRSFTFSGGYWESHLQLIRVNEQGDILWNKVFNEGVNATSIRIYDLKETKDAGFILAGSSAGASSFFILKVNKEGQEEWRNSLSKVSPYSGVQANQIIETTDGGYLLAGKDVNGYIYGTSQYNDNMLIVKVDAKGQELWRQNIDKGGRDVALAATEVENGDYIVGGSIQDDPENEVYTHKAFATRLTQTGEVVWAKAIFGDTLSNSIKYLKALDDNTILAVGDNYHYKREAGGTNDCLKLSLDAQGNIVSEKIVLANALLFYYENTPLEEVLVGSYFRNEFRVVKGQGDNGAGCNIEATVTADKPLALCPGEALTLTAEEGFSSYKWSTGETTRSITVTQAGDYRVEVTNEIGCLYATDPVTVTVKEPYAGDQICYVTVDKATGKNKIIWNKTADQSTAFYSIYKEAVGGYAKVGTVAFDESSSYIDNTSQPNAKTERYSVRAVDACGNETTTATFHKTVLLQASLGTTGEVNLTWNRYEGAPAIKTIIYRGKDDASLAAIAELPAQEDRYIDRAPVSDEKIYRIGVELDANCSAQMEGGRLAQPMATKAIALSNTLNLRVAGLDDDYETGSKLITVWPNPVEDVATINIAHTQSRPAKLQLLNATGHFVKEQNVTGHKITLNTNSLPAGLYIVAVTLQNGNTLKKKIILW